MRPTTPWDTQAILAYIPRPQIQKLQYVIIRAGELKQLHGVEDSDNGFYQSIAGSEGLVEAIDYQLVLEGFPSVTPPPLKGTYDPNLEKRLRLQLTTQEDELTMQDERIEKLEAELEVMKTLSTISPVTKQTKPKVAKKRGDK